MLCIQDPEYENSFLLNEALLEACENAEYGAGTYAFVSANGIDLLMKNSIFEKFIETGKYFLVIGMDEITNINTINAITEYQNVHPNLSVKAFVHSTTGSTYHPKFSWFKTKEGGYLVTGSGNLTQKGLRRNREAYVLEKVSSNQIEAIEAEWNGWIKSCESYLLDINDEKVLEKAKENNQKDSERIKHKSTARKKSKEDRHSYEKREKIEYEDESGAWEFTNDSLALLAELPIGRDRKSKKWCQANFDIETLKSYFGTKPNAKYEIILRCVTKEGIILDIEKRPVISKQSNNYCFELTPPQGTLYPPNGRPIGVFVKIAVRTFLYMVIMPDDEYHEKLAEKLENYRVRENRLVRYQLPVEELKEVCNNLPILDYIEE